MSRRLMAAALAASLGAFAIAYALTTPGEDTAGPVELQHRLTRFDPGPPPSDWHTQRLPGSPAILAYPHSWQAIDGDPGTASAALRVGGHIVGYLNATPQGGAETTANWLRFRPAHNRAEGDEAVLPRAGMRGVRLRSGPGSCLIDDYTTATGARYRELACIVRGRRADSVVVGSALRSHWQRLAPVLRTAVSSFST
jgi:hypothetical protein